MSHGNGSSQLDSRYLLVDSDHDQFDNEDFDDFHNFEDDAFFQFDADRPSYPPPPSRQIDDIIVKNHRGSVCGGHLKTVVLLLAVVGFALIIYFIFFAASQPVIKDDGVRNVYLYMDESEIMMNYTQQYAIDNSNNYFSLTIEEANIIVTYKDDTMGQYYSNKEVHVKGKDDNRPWKLAMQLYSNSNATVASIADHCDNEKFFYINYRGNYKIKYLTGTHVHNVEENHKIDCDRKP